MLGEVEIDVDDMEVGMEMVEVERRCRRDRRTAQGPKSRNRVVQM